MDLSPAILLAQDAAATTGTAGSGLMDMVFLTAFMIAILYFFVIRPQNQERDAKQKLVEALQKGDRVVTQGGLIGKIDQIKGDEVVLKADDQNKIKLRVLKTAILRVVPPGSSLTGDDNSTS